MSRDQILASLRQALPELRSRYGLKDLSLFGSVARDEAGPQSDVDVLVTYAEPVTLRAFMGLKTELERRLGMPVDLLTPGAIKSRLRAAIERDLLRVS